MAGKLYATPPQARRNPTLFEELGVVHFYLKKHGQVKSASTLRAGAGELASCWVSENGDWTVGGLPVRYGPGRTSPERYT